MGRSNSIYFGGADIGHQVPEVSCRTKVGVRPIWQFDSLAYLMAAVKNAITTNKTH